MANKILSGIYKIENTVNGKSYVGSAVNFPSRWSGHRRSLQTNKHHSAALQNAWNKYGESAFAFLIIEIVEAREFLIACEQKWFDSLKPEYNVAKTAGSPLGVRHSAEVNKKKGLANLGKKLSEETKQKLRIASIGRKPPCTPEVIAKRVEKLRGKKRPAHAIEATRKARIGMKVSDESRLKMSIASKGRAKAPFTDEHKRNISLSNLGRIHSGEARLNMSNAAKLRGAPKLTREQIDSGAEKRRGAKRTPDQRRRMIDGRIAARVAREELQTKAFSQ